MKNIGLALQGGGSYAAFTAGVLKGLLDPQKQFLTSEQIHSISGTSGGALNSLLLGLAIHEQQEDPVVYVKRLWEINRIEQLLKARFALLKLVPDEFLAFFVGLSHAIKESSPMLSAVLTQYSKMSAFVNETIHEIIHHAAPSLPHDPDVRLLTETKPYVTVAATEVKTAKAHYFTNNKTMIQRYEQLKVSQKHRVLKELTLRGVYASAAHPNILASVEIDDNLYWDGYYTSNPPFFYLFREGCDEVILVRLIQQKRAHVGNEPKAIQDRIEEIIQNSTLNMEIQMYLLMREILMNNRELKAADFSLGMRTFKPTTMYHEIRMLKSGNISDERYPLSTFVDKLLRMGEKVVSAHRGFIDTYRKADIGLQIISHIDFETERVNSYTVDIDKLLFEEEELSAGSQFQTFIRKFSR